ncbi:MAG: hypothetical protein WCE58_09005 [Gallionella sp.]
MRIVSLLAAITLTGFAISVNAAYDEELGSAKLHDLDNSIKHHSGNILAIKQGLLTQAPTNQRNVKDVEYSDDVLSVLSEISIESETLIEHQSLFGKMGSEHGKTSANARVIDDVRILKDKCGPYLDEINLNLNKIKSDDLVFEVKNARDDAVKICGIIQRWE